MKFTPNGSFIVSSSLDSTLKVWDAATGEERLSLIGHTGFVRGCAISPYARFVISASGDATLKLWKVQTGSCLLTFPVNDSLFGCAFYPDGKHVVACGVLGVYFLRFVSDQAFEEALEQASEPIQPPLRVASSPSKLSASALSKTDCFGFPTCSSYSSEASCQRGRSFTK